MRIAFIDISGDYNAITPILSPLGGTESSICYLATTLAQRGHEVSILNKVGGAGVYANVYSLSINDNLTVDYLNSRDVIICSNAAFLGKRLKDSGIIKPLIFWSGHDTNQPAVNGLSDQDTVSCWENIVLVSLWQAERYIKHLGVSESKIRILPNAIGLPFDNQNRSVPFFFECEKPPVLIYASAPHRGLFELIKSYPLIKSQIPGAILNVYSSMKMYGVPLEEDKYKLLYDVCMSTEGIFYYGSVNQQELCQAMLESDVFIYPSTFEETSCISLMQAMSCGCLPLFNDYGALKETAAGFGKYLQPLNNPGSNEFIEEFSKFSVTTILDAYENKDNYSISLTNQISYVRKNYSWERVAILWEDFFKAGQ